jgi:hypothetical protein
MEKILTPHLGTDTLDVAPILSKFHDSLYYALEAEARNPDVVAFKSVVCYRTGLDISTFISQASLKFSILEIFKKYQSGENIRLCYKALNDMVVQVALEVAASHDIPGKPHISDNHLADLDYSSISHWLGRQRPDAAPILAFADASDHQGIPKYQVCVAPCILPLYPGGWIFGCHIPERVPRLRLGMSPYRSGF